MFLRRLTVSGFKTFAKKTDIRFDDPKSGANALTVIVGPNGSGKSNLADAIRWCLGEQSVKMLRGKETQDVIFSGSEGKGRSGFAEVEMELDNSDRALDIDYTEVTITRRLYRDGESDYLLNGKSVRLQDVQLLLAQAGIGQRTYTVIAQGMIDHVLTSSPEERKIFFDDATGVRALQMKRHQSILKLKKATENMIDIERLLAEIEPRLKLLKRQVKRLDEREAVERELADVQERYFGTLFWQLKAQVEASNADLKTLEGLVKEKETRVKELDAELGELERGAKKASPIEGLREAQEAYRKAQQTLREAEQERFKAERDLELARAVAQTSWAPLSLEEILRELDAILTNDDATPTQKILSAVRTLKQRLTKPKPSDINIDPALQKAKDAAQKSIAVAEKSVKDAEAAIEALSKKKEAQADTRVFDVQRSVRAVQSELHVLEQKKSQHAIEKARAETQLAGVQSEMQEMMRDTGIITKEKPKAIEKHLDETRAQMLRLRQKLELIGGIDEETVKEFEETQTRFTFLSEQLEDLKRATAQTERVIDELDEDIRKQSEKAFAQINKEFQKYFKVLFGGGNASLTKITTDDVEENLTAFDRALEEVAKSVQTDLEEQSESEKMLARFHKRRASVSGVEIQATPPGKKLKSLNLLSGGERALTSIALLCAIMSTNPSPFVVLDEVDAALDEANTVRFANILDELRKLSQFIVITHNRATMERADLLYGVTMGDDGISNLLSVKLSDIEDVGSARR